MKLQDLETRVAAWVRTRLGDAGLHPRERAARVLEEALELAQAERVPEPLVRRLVEHVYSRPAGEAIAEGGNVAVCLLGWCAARKQKLANLAQQELTRMEMQPMKQVRCSLERKAAAQLFPELDGPEAA
jgi:hypothetical protein